MITKLLQTTLPVVDEQKLIQTTDSLRTVTEEFVNVLKTDPHTAVTQLVHSAIEFGLKVLAAIIIYVIGLWLIKRVKKMMNRNFERKHTDKTIASFTNSMVSVVLTILVITLCIGTLGVNTTSLAALLAAGGMALGMALSGTLQNFAGGIMLLIFKPFKVGDFIEAQGYSGTVSEVNMVSTKLISTDNRVIIIPNGALSSSNINNYSDKFIEKVNSIIAADARVFDSFVAVNDLNTTGVEFVIKLWVKSPDYWPVYHDFYKTLYTELNKENFSFAANRLDISGNASPFDNQSSANAYNI